MPWQQTIQPCQVIKNHSAPETGSLQVPRVDRRDSYIDFDEW